MKKKLCLALLVFAVMTLFLRGIPYVAAGIAARGVWGVNYGSGVFPSMLGALALQLYRQQE